MLFSPNATLAAKLSLFIDFKMSWIDWSKISIIIKMCRLHLAYITKTQWEANSFFPTEIPLLKSTRSKCKFTTCTGFPEPLRLIWFPSREERRGCGNEAAVRMCFTDSHAEVKADSRSSFPDYDYDPQSRAVAHRQGANKHLLPGVAAAS